MTPPPSEPPVLLIHGVGSTFDHNWQQPGWVDLLHDAGREVIGVELPGHGAEAARGPADRDAARHLLDAAAPFGQVDAVGFSAGGYALMRAAVYEPDRFGRIALLGVGEAGLGENANESGMRAIADALLAEEEPSGGMPLIIRRMCRANGNDRTAVATFLASHQPRVTSSDLSAISARTIVVQAEEDGPAGGVADAIPGAKYVFVKGVDHFGLPASFECIDAVLTHLGVST